MFFVLDLADIENKKQDKTKLTLKRKKAAHHLNNKNFPSVNVQTEEQPRCKRQLPVIQSCPITIENPANPVCKIQAELEHLSSTICSFCKRVLHVC